MIKELYSDLQSFIGSINRLDFELEAVSQQIRYGFKNIGNDKCADCIDRVISNYHIVKNVIGNPDISKLLDWDSVIHSGGGRSFLSSDVELDTQILKDVSENIRALNKKNSDLLDDLNLLILPKPNKTVIRSILIKNNLVLSACASYLSDTAANYDRIENNIIKALESGNYVVEDSIKDTIPQKKPDNKIKIKDLIDLDEAIKEFDNILRDGDMNILNLISWFWEHIIFGSGVFDTIFSDLFKNSKSYYKFKNDIFEFLQDGSKITDFLDEFNIEMPKGLDDIFVVLSIIEAAFARFYVAMGVIAIVKGRKTDDTEMVSAGFDYIDEALTSISDLAVTLCCTGEPHAFLIGLGVDSAVNSVTNLIEGIVNEESALEILWGVYCGANIETILDLTIGNFVCQQGFKKNYEVPIKKVLDVVIGFSQKNGNNLLENPFINKMYTTDNWMKEIYEFSMDLIDKPFMFNIKGD